MTQQVRRTYRNHRRGAWAAVSALVVLVAAVMIPLASGAPPKYYTLDASPTDVCDTPAVQKFTLTLTNDARNTPLGSANITAPSNAALQAGTAYVSPPGTATVNGNTIEVRNLELATGKSAAVTVDASVSTGGPLYWTSIAKQSNDFADAPGPGNLLELRGLLEDRALTVSQCSYVFTQGPVDAKKNVAQTVKVELQTAAGTNKSSGQLTLTAHREGVNVSGNFSGLGPATASGDWTFEVVGTVSGTDYTLKAGTTESSPFDIADCVPDASGSCTIPFTPNTTGTTGAKLTGSGLGSSIVLSFASIPPIGMAICANRWTWSPLTYPGPGGAPTTFDGLELSSYTVDDRGFVRLTHYLRNDLFVLSNPDNGNDIPICAGAMHTVLANGPSANAFMGRGGISAQWDSTTQLYWGVLERIPNCNKPLDLNGDEILDPALCAWGTEDVGGVLYRTFTVVIPYDWDWKGFS